ncbi:ABC transporter substrate-binding protein [Microcella daejeonensis]|uniref:ABC transporter substrate-binding protein n=1 Tax=Microcella daejeonensis TaxID=2994971 RepID=UPI00226E4829|nr:ABC transporter substrate-binding protein [Microcella daejeonensis]WAB84725.1 ABC transporter substrate-binding protein [Microcella daejeonensis]
MRSRSPYLPAAGLLGAAALILTGCGSGVDAATDSAAEEPTVRIENCGREIALSAAPDSVVGMHPSQTELLLRLGLKDRMVGQAQAEAQALPEDVAALAADIPVIGGVMPPSREDLLTVEPDFVYSPTTYEFSAEQGFASVEQLESAGASVYVATGGCFERRMTGEVTDLFDDLWNLGSIFGVEEVAAELIDRGTADLAQVETATADVDRLRVAQVYVEGSTMSAIGAGVEFDILTRAGADTVYAPDQPAFSEFFAAPITPESLAAEQPDAIVFATYDAEHEAATRAYLTATFPGLPAVVEGRLIAISTSDTFPGTLGNVSAVRQIAEELYPEAF